MSSCAVAVVASHLERQSPVWKMGARGSVLKEVLQHLTAGLLMIYNGINKTYEKNRMDGNPYGSVRR